MNGTMTSDQAMACLNLALERNKQLFNEAYRLSHAALDLLDQPHMDIEKFTRYQKKRRQADLKYLEAIEHLRLIMAEYPAHLFSAQSSIHESQFRLRETTKSDLSGIPDRPF
jgi:uncharacterized membrane protein